MSYFRVSGGIAMAAVALLLGLGFSAAAAPDTGRFETELGPTPINHVTKDQLNGHGTANASLNRSKLSVSGTFTGLATAATDAHVMMGSGIGVERSYSAGWACGAGMREPPPKRRRSARYGARPISASIHQKP